MSKYLAGTELHFFHSTLYMVMFWICAENRVDNTEMFLLLLSNAYTESRPFLLLTPHHLTGKEAEGAQGFGRGHSWDSWPQLTKGISHTMWHHAQHIKLEKKEGGDVRSGGVCLPKPLLCVMEPCFPGDGWTPACRWEAVNQFLGLLCLRVQLLLYPLNCLYLNPQVFSLLPLQFSPLSWCWRGISERLGGA